MRTGKLARRFVILLAVWLIATTSLVTVAVWRNPAARAMIGMGWGLILLWIGVGGGLMHLFREKIQAFTARVRLGWRWKFILFSTALALLEEAITTTMTNLAPVFGVRPGEAFITASANYIDVVTMHSVVVFIPMFVGWQWLLGRWRFTPFQVFVLFGITGTLAECSFGVQHLREFGLWIFVYGLMVWLPAHCAPVERLARPPRWWHFPLAIIVPFAFIPMIPTPLLVKWIDPHHPTIHFQLPSVESSTRAIAGGFGCHRRTTSLNSAWWRYSPGPTGQVSQWHSSQIPGLRGTSQPRSLPAKPSQALRGCGKSVSVRRARRGLIGQGRTYSPLL